MVGKFCETENGKGAHRKDFRVLATAAPPGFARGFRPTRGPFCSDMDTERLGIEFQAGRGEFYLLFPVGGGSNMAAARGLSPSPARARRIGLGFSHDAMFIYSSLVSLGHSFASTWNEESHPIVACLNRLRGRI